MNDNAVTALAGAAFAGALVAHPLSGRWFLVLALVGVGGLLRRRTVVVAICVFALAAGLSGRAWTIVHTPAPSSVDGVGRIVTDPERQGAATRAVVEVGGRRYLASGWGSAGWALSQTRAGERVHVEGRVAPYGGTRERIAALHTAHRLSLEVFEPLDGGAWHWQVANKYRSLVDGGAASLGGARRSLFTGLVYGDDRGQDPLVAADFRSAGLTHLLAVSGQNVAYVLTLLAPLLRRLGPRARWAASLVALALFITATRVEPSVLRASVMAAMVVTSRVLGRESSPRRSLSLAVLILVLVDPFLASSVAFRLSVAASAGIVVLTPRLVDVLVGPKWLREPLAVTLGAQLAVAPIMIATFGPVSVATLPANLLAGPVAGLVMMWGMTAGALAGLVGGAPARLLHLPTRVMLWWLETVARFSATAPLPRLGLAGIVAVLGVVWIWRRHRRTRLALLLGAALCTAVVPARTPAAERIGWDSVLLRGESDVLVVGVERNAVSLIDELRGRGVDDLGLVVVTDTASLGTMALVARRVAVAEIWSAEPSGVSVAVEARRSVRVGSVTLLVEPGPGDLAVGVADTVTGGF